MLKEIFIERSIVMGNGKKQACKAVQVLKQALIEILITVVSAVIAEAVIRLIFQLAGWSGVCLDCRSVYL